MITFQSVTKSYRSGSLILSDIDLTIREGEFVCILGPSGCGKTTLLNLLAGFIFPTSGHVRLEGKNVTAPGPDRGVVFQDATLFPWLTVAENVAFGLRNLDASGRSLNKTVRHYLNLMGLGGHGNKYPHMLSGGMRQRVAIARVLALKPKVMLMDEPFSALDANTRERLQDELLRVWTSDRRTIVYVTHSVEEAAYLADRVIVLGDSSTGIIVDKPIFLKRPRHRSSADFLAMKDELRSALSAQPCCFQPQFS